MISYYTKCIVAALIAFGGSITTALQDGVITPVEWVAAAITLVVAGGATFAVPNVPESVRIYGKAIVAGLTAGLGSLGTALTDGNITSAEIITIVTALVVGSGLVGIAPNAGQSDPPFPDDLVIDPDHDTPDGVPPAVVPDEPMPDGFTDGAGESTPERPDFTGKV